MESRGVMENRNAFLRDSRKSNGSQSEVWTAFQADIMSYQLVLCSEGPVQSFDLTGAQNCLLSERATEKPQGEAVPAWPSLDPKGAHTFCLQLLETVLERSVKSKTNC